MKRLLVLPLFLATTLTISSAMVYASNTNEQTDVYESLGIQEYQETIESLGIDKDQTIVYEIVPEDATTFGTTSYDENVTTVFLLPDGACVAFSGEPGIGVEYNYEDMKENSTLEDNVDSNLTPSERGDYEKIDFNF